MELRKATLILCALLLSVMLAACGGGSSDPTATPAAPVAPAAATTPADADEDVATPTVELAPTETVPPATPTEEPATPTTDPTATSTVAPTATVAATETPDASAAEPTATDAVSTPEATTEVDAEAEAALFAMALSEDDLPEGWIEYASGPVTDSDDDLTFCNAEPFSSPGGRIAAIELEFEVDPAEGPFLLQNLTAYPEDVAIEAMEYARTEVVNCDEWTEEFSGETYRLIELDLPEYGDESLGVAILFEVPEFGEVSVEFAFVRVGGILLSLGFIDMDAVDTAEFERYIERAVEKVEASDFRS